jgi:hypothetical protein
MLTQEGDIAVHRMVTCVVTDLRMGRIRRLELEGRIKLGCAWVAECGHQEVYEPGPQAGIEAAVNQALPPGWQPV